MTILSFFIVCARFEVFGQLTSYVPATDGDGHIDYEEFSKILLNQDAGDHERPDGATKVKRKIATHAKKDVRLGASADESKDSAH